MSSSLNCFFFLKKNYNFAKRLSSVLLNVTRETEIMPCGSILGYRSKCLNAAAAAE